MAPLLTLTPLPRMSKKALPAPLAKAILHIFANCGRGVWLVGGTALAAYYAEHRRSDDIDLFAGNPDAFRAAVLAVKSLKGLGAELEHESQSPLYYRAGIRFHGHEFNADVVLDEHVHAVGDAHKTQEGVVVASIQTLMAMKVACLVSRCSEKDLFDLDWLFAHAGEPAPAELVELGSSMDAGLTVETLLISLKGAMLRKDACGFFLSGARLTRNEVYKKVVALQKKLIHALLEYEKSIPLSSDAAALRQAVKEMKKLMRK